MLCFSEYLLIEVKHQIGEKLSGYCLAEVTYAHEPDVHGPFRRVLCHPDAIEDLKRVRYVGDPGIDKGLGSQ